jgi:uncharacterized cupin superfamily protein
MDFPSPLLTAAAIEALPGRHKVHDLNPNAVRSAKFLAGAAGLGKLGFDLMTVQPGQDASEFHRHLYEEECYYILAGSGTIRIEDRTHPVGPGDFLGFRANGVAHTLSNTGTEPLVFLMARTKLEQDVCDYPDRNKRLYMNGDEEAFVNLDEVIRL